MNNKLIGFTSCKLPVNNNNEQRVLNIKIYISKLIMCNFLFAGAHLKKEKKLRI